MRKIYWISLLVATSLALIYLFESYYADFMPFFSRFFSLSMAGASAAMAIFALKKYWEAINSRLTQVWIFFAAGLILLFLGEVAQTFYTLTLTSKIICPSAAHALWLIGCTSLISALMLYLSLVQPAISKQIRAVSYATVFVIATVFSYLFMIPVAISEGNVLTRVINVANPSLDLVLLAFSIEGLLVFTTTRLKGKIDNVWIILSTGILMKAIADALLCCTTSRDMYYYGHPLEFFFQLGYLMFLLAFYIHTKEL